GFVARARPTGKIAIEVRTSELPIRTADRARVGAIAFLERRSGPPSVQRISGNAAVERILADMPTYGDEIDEIHERAVCRLSTLPAYILRYDAIHDGVQQLSAL